MIVQSVVQSARQEFMCVSKHPVRVHDSDCVHRQTRRDNCAKPGRREEASTVQPSPETM